MANKSIELSRYEHLVPNGTDTENRYGYFATKNRVLDLICTTPLVDPQITSTKFVIKKQDGTVIETRTSNSNHSIEVGAKVDIECKYKWVAVTGKLPPAATISNAWPAGNNPPAANTEVIYTVANYTANTPATKSMKIQFSSPRTAPQVSGDKLLRPTGNIVSSTQTRSLAFSYLKFTGKLTTKSPTEAQIKSLTNESLSNQRSIIKTGINTVIDNSYYCYAYPAALGNLANILANDVDAILTLFEKHTITITNKYGLAIIYNVYISSNPGAFVAGTKLSFS